MTELLEQTRVALAARYSVEREIGRGQAATVFLAQDLKHPRRVVVKVLDPGIARLVGPDRFLREIKIAASLSHPHIVPIYESGNEGGLLYYVMPYVEGESLRARLRRERRLPVEEALRIAREAADGLACAHRHDVLHRDVKPENILLEEGHAVIADFGIARAIRGVGEATLTETGFVVGTPAYMSPEQVLGNRRLDGRSDLYSLGCVLYEMLAGEPPFRGETQASYLHQHAAVQPRPLAKLRSEVPEGLSRVLERALAKSPEERYATGEELAQALTPPFGPVRSRRARWLVAAAAAGLVVALVAGAILLWPKAPSSRAPSASPNWILLADFEGPGDDPALAEAVRELVRAGLDQSAVVQAVSREQVRYALELAQKPETTRVTGDLARELAQRNSIRAVLEGQVLRVGSGFSLVVRVVDVQTGRLVASASGSAGGEDQLIPAAGRLSRSLREQLGERRDALQYQSVSSSQIDAITPSFEAYRLFSKAVDLNSIGSDRESIRWYRAALAVDPDFATAWLFLAVGYFNCGEADSATVAIEEAMRRPQRLTRYWREYANANRLVYACDLPGGVMAFGRLARDFPSRDVGVNDYGYMLKLYGDLDRAEEAFKQAHEVGVIKDARIRWNYFESLVTHLKLDDARRQAGQLPRAFRTSAELEIAVASDSWTAAESLARATEADPSVEPDLRARAAMVLAGVQATRGQMGDAVASLARAASASANGGYRPWFHQACRLRVLTRAAAGVPRRTAGAEKMPDTTLSSQLTRAIVEADRGDLQAARVRLWKVMARPSPALARLGAAPQLLEGWIAFQGGDQQAVVERLGPAARRGSDVGCLEEDRAGRVLTRWLVGSAYERLGQRDSAVTYYEGALDPDRMYWEERVQRALLYSYLHQRLAVLYGQLGRGTESRAHWATFSRAFTRPDPELRRLLEEAGAALAER